MDVDRGLESRARRAESHWGIYGPRRALARDCSQASDRSVAGHPLAGPKDWLACAASEVFGPHCALGRLSTRHMRTLARRVEHAESSGSEDPALSLQKRLMPDRARAPWWM